LDKSRFKSSSSIKKFRN